ncbi:hypothetical protein ACJIZ3_012957 [Penstemon smallii]|uniref:GPI-anchored protein LLG1-like domain-containing protein n=1 Tax=Penstemon smallii TaxID=265156 RepID=A0ABD3UNV7_9LAMI
MGLCQIKCSLIVVICVSLFTALSASTFISDGAFGSSVLSERRLLQVKKPCPISFEFQNYNVITSRCRGPDYPANMCCSALKEFACPFADELNDLSNDCASSMFSYINLAGKYPPGLFSSECRDSKVGLECPTPAPAPAAHTNSATRKICQLLLLIAPSLLLISL